MTDPGLLDAIAQAELVRRKEVKPIELVEAAIGRIERLNPKINAVVTKMYDIARESAEQPLPDGPLAGVPFLLKDLTAAYAGVPMGWGSEFTRKYVPDHDSELVRRQKRAGLVFLGKTNTPEFGLLATTEPRAYGPTRNPWDTSRIAGGSSGGAAAAVAAGMVAIAHGNDGGGSIRGPAACCGVFGLKPTRGRNPAGPDYGERVAGLAAEHALTQSVRDSAALLDATCGPDIGDPYWAPPPARPFLQEVDADPGRLRIAFSAETLAGTPVHPDCIEAVRDAASLCADLGHEVTEGRPETNVEMLGEALTTVWAASCASSIDSFSRLMGKTPDQEQLEPLTWALIEFGRSRTAADYFASITLIHKVSREIGRFFIDHDLWLTPTTTDPPLPLGTIESTPEQPFRAWARSGRFLAFTSICNVTGQPAMSVPLNWNAEGLPIGSHFIARFGEEATLFRLAAQLEQARPWRNRTLPTSL